VRLKSLSPPPRSRSPPRGSDSRGYGRGKQPDGPSLFSGPLPSFKWEVSHFKDEKARKQALKREAKARRKWEAKNGAVPAGGGKKTNGKKSKIEPWSERLRDRSMIGKNREQEARAVEKLARSWNVPWSIGTTRAEVEADICLIEEEKKAIRQEREIVLLAKKWGLPWTHDLTLDKIRAVINKKQQAEKAAKLAKKWGVQWSHGTSLQAVQAKVKAIRKKRQQEVLATRFRPSDFPQAFSHFSFVASGHRQLVCDIQGVFTHAKDGQPPLFELTDPVILRNKEYVEAGGVGTGRRAENGADKGIEEFFKLHKCNDVCRRLGLREWTAQ
jgi:hypothetical protein